MRGARAGARRRYQRMLPRVIARMAELSASLSAASAERPRSVTASSARAAPASAGAPGAQRDLAKPSARERLRVGEIACAHRISARPLNLGDRDASAATLYGDVIGTNLDDRPKWQRVRIGSEQGALVQGFFEDVCGEDAQRLPVE